MDDASLFTDLALNIGVPTLREQQLNVCLDYAAGHDTFFIAPTGFGKSIVYQLAPLFFNKKFPEYQNRVIVIEPTIGLVKDSIAKLKKICPDLSSVHLTPATISKAKSASYIFTSPEMILSQLSRTNLLSDTDFMNSIRCIFVDECHIIEQWGVSDKDMAFRNSYADLGELRSFTKVPVVAMTATANYTTVGFVKHSLNMEQVKETKIDIEKKNISYHIYQLNEDTPRNLSFIVDLMKLRQEKLDRTLIFFNSVNTLTTMYQYLRREIGQSIGEQNPMLVMFTSHTDQTIKENILADLNNPDGLVRVVLCTSALSVGVSVSSVKYVIHYGAPTHAQEFVQETGRAAREHYLHGHSILLTFPRMNPKGLSPTMKTYIAGEKCRRKILLEAFQCDTAISQVHGCCDICDRTMTFSIKDILVQHIVKGHVDPSFSSTNTSDSGSSRLAPSLNDIDSASVVSSNDTV